MRHPRKRRARRGAAGAGGAARVLVISASMGAGHDGAARELRSRLVRAGHRAEVRDLLDAAPLWLGPIVRWLYEQELRHAPAAYDRTYRLWYRTPWLCPLVTWLVCFLTRRRVLRWTRRSGAQVVVSTYPLATLCLGRLRRIGRLSVPTVNFITDFGVHPLWVHRGIDVNLAVHPAAAEAATARSGRPALACGPLVAEGFGRRDGRDAARAELGLEPDDRAVLIVAGSWGVGDVEETFRSVAGCAGYVPVVVCGRDQTTRRRLERLAAATGARSVVLGWTDRMPELMTACDALVENAGGLTAFEALRAGLPVVSYHPIAGHGRENTSAMAAAGVSRLAADRDELLASLDALTRPGAARVDQLLAGAGIFVSDGSAHVVDAMRPAAMASLARPPRLRVLWASASRAATAVAVAAALIWSGLTTGVGVATAFGAGVAHAAPGAYPVAYVGVRLDAAELLDPRVVRAVRSLGVTIVVDRVSTFGAARQIRDLAAEGVDIENGGQGAWVSPLGKPEKPTLWTRALGDVNAGRALSTLTRRPVQYFIPGRRLNAFDLYDAAKAGDKVVLAGAQIFAGQPSDPIPTIRPKEIVLVDGLHATNPELLAALARLERDLATQRLAPVAIDTLT